eukprot:12666498-Prorocentrum_lima.AAC.1
MKGSGSSGTSSSTAGSSPSPWTNLSMRCKVSVLRFPIPSILSATTLWSSGGSIRGSQFSFLGVG